MVAILVCYGTGEGQTAKVADRIAEELTVHGHDPTVVNAADVEIDFDLDEYAAVLVGASVHFGRHQKAVRQFVTTHRDALVTKPTGFFQVSGASADEESAAAAVEYVDEFTDATNWRPDRIGLFGGAIRFSKYGFLLGGLMKLVAKEAFPEARTDATGDVEFTDWESVDAFAAEFAAFVDERTGTGVDAS